MGPAHTSSVRSTSTISEDCSPRWVPKGTAKVRHDNPHRHYRGNRCGVDCHRIDAARFPFFLVHIRDDCFHVLLPCTSRSIKPSVPEWLFRSSVTELRLFISYDFLILVSVSSLLLYCPSSIASAIHTHTVFLSTSYKTRTA